jgi:maltose alpha-D-glucosyltransferase / alpha-amylase
VARLGVLDWLVEVAFPAFLQRQRWFAGKARSIARVELANWGRFEDSNCAITLLDVTDSEGHTDRYFLPIVFIRADAGTAPDLAVIARLTAPPAGIIADAAVDDNAVIRLAMMTGGAGGSRMTVGRIEGLTPDGGAEFPGGALAPVVRGKAEQSNTTFFLAKRFAFKWIRKLEKGLNPDVEIGLHLARVGFSHTPRLVGALNQVDRVGGSATLAMMQRFVPNDGNGWEQAEVEVRAFFDHGSAQVKSGRGAPAAAANLLHAGDPPPDVRGLIPYLPSAEMLGRRTAELHVALATDATGAFAPSPITRDDLVTTAAAMRERGRDAIAALERALPSLVAEVKPLAAAVIDGGESLLAPFDDFGASSIAVDRIRVHGDYHLGQVLRASGDFFIVDFEGEPMRPLAERRRPEIALKDVAGMLRSLEYAVYGGLWGAVARGQGDFATLEPWAWMWQSWAAAAFLDGYRQAAGLGRFMPRDSRSLHVALDAYLRDRALYELVYELNNRPTWVGVPLCGLWRRLTSSPHGSP